MNDSFWQDLNVEKTKAITPCNFLVDKIDNNFTRDLVMNESFKNSDEENNNLISNKAF